MVTGKETCSTILLQGNSLGNTKSTQLLVDLQMHMYCHTQIRRGSPIVVPTVEVQSRKTELVLITIQNNNII